MAKGTGTEESFRENHYVPKWYQRRFLMSGDRERKYFLLDMSPEQKSSGNGQSYARKSLRHLGPISCFVERDLYTTKFLTAESTEIEQKFFGPLDEVGTKALDFIEAFNHDRMSHERFNDLVSVMSLQRLRTPNGLHWLAKNHKIRDRNITLLHLQSIWKMHCGIWSEAVWSIVDASGCETKFIVSDNPVTFYNSGVFPASPFAQQWGDADLRMRGTHTIYPLSLNKALILTHLAWVRNPYGAPQRLHPNPNFFRTGIWNATEVQVGRRLTEEDVAAINFVIKRRATRYVAAARKEWLEPEKVLNSTNWRKIGDRYRFMPDPRLVQFSDGVVFGFGKGQPAARFDEYGRRPWQSKADHDKKRDAEWRSFRRFQGEYARLHGPEARGSVLEMGQRSSAELCRSLHQHYLDEEKRYAPKMPGRKNR